MALIHRFVKVPQKYRHSWLQNASTSALTAHVPVNQTAIATHAIHIAIAFFDRRSYALAGHGLLGHTKLALSLLVAAGGAETMPLHLHVIWRRTPSGDSSSTELARGAAGIIRLGITLGRARTSAACIVNSRGRQRTLEGTGEPGEHCMASLRGCNGKRFPHGVEAIWRLLAIFSVESVILEESP